MAKKQHAFPEHHKVTQHKTYVNPGLPQDLFRGPIAKAVIPGQARGGQSQNTLQTGKSDRPLRRP